jgi:hypothetical protein
MASLASVILNLSIYTLRPTLHQFESNIYCHVLATKRGVWISNWIYNPLTTTNYNSFTDLNTPQITVLQHT